MKVPVFPIARDKDPITSHEAADKMVKSGKLNRQEEMVFNAIVHYAKTHKVFNTKDIAKYWWPATYYNAYDICRKRFSGLERKGKIELVYEWDGLRIKDFKRRDGCRVWRLVRK